MGLPEVDLEIRKLARRMCRAKEHPPGLNRFGGSANPHAERVIDSIHRECTNHVIVLGEHRLRRILGRYVYYDNKARAHLSLDKDASEVRPIYSTLADGVQQTEN